MNCEDCTNKTYCEPFKRDNNLRGCGSGIPEFLPSVIARTVARKVDRAVDAMDFDRAKYSRDVLQEVKKALGI